MSWWTKLTGGIKTSTRDKKEAPDGVWEKCRGCKKPLTIMQLKETDYICPHCDHHRRIGSAEYFPLLFDNEKFEYHFDGIYAKDFLKFKDLKAYEDRLIQAKTKTGLEDAIRVASGKVNSEPLVVVCMDFSFIGGSMGSVVGEKISMAIDLCLKKKWPLMVISKSGGARMMESAFSLMQMAKTSAKLTLLAKKKLPYISLMTDPTTGGVSASYAMLGDLNIAEPGALIGFAGPRVIKETIKKDLPDGFQTSEFLLEHGFLDFIVHRSELRDKLSEALRMLKVKKVPAN